MAASVAEVERAGGPHVVAILVLRDGAPWLPECLDALASQTRPPDHLIAVDVASTDGSGALVTNHEGLLATVPHRELLTVDSIGTFAEAVSYAVARLPEGSTWLWIVSDDSAPDPGALAALTGAVRRSPSVRVAGPKVVAWDNPKQLLDVGYQLTRSGRRIFAPAPGEADQGQYDQRTDVLAVGTTCMLVRRDVFESLDGLDSAFPEPADALDFGWRAQLAGHRVVVVPAARARDAGARFGRERTTEPDPRAVRRLQRSATRRVALARCSTLAAPFLALWIALSSVASAVGLLLLKRPAHAWLAMGDITALAHPVSSLRSRWRFRRRRALARRDLATLFVTSGEAARHTWDKVQDALTPTRRTALDTQDDTETETGPVAPEADNLAILPSSFARRVITNPGVLATTMAAGAAGYGFRSALTSGVLDVQGAGLVGGQLQRVTTDAAGMWHTFRDGWHGAGWGTNAESSPAVVVITALSWLAERLPVVAQGRSPVSVTIAWLLILSLPMATVTAYAASRILPVSSWLRAIAALAWGAGGLAQATVQEGRVTAALAHVLLPLVAAGIVRLARRDGTYTAAAATSLGAGVVGALEPLILVPVALAALVLTVLGPGVSRRLRAASLLVFPLALQGPWLLRLTHDSVALLAPPGLVDTTPASDVPTWMVAVGLPLGASSLQALLTLPVIALAVISTARRPRSRAESATVSALGLLVVLGTGYAVLARSIVVDTLVGGGSLQGLAPPVMTAWPGVGSQIALLALLGLGLLGSRRLAAVVGASGWGWRRWLVGSATAATAVSLLGALGLGVNDRLDNGLSTAGGALPAVAVDQSRGPDANRLLVLRPTPSYLDYELVGAEPGSVLRGVTVPTAATDPGLGPVVRALASGTFDPDRPAGPRLADLGVGFVSVRGTADPSLIRTLDAAPGVVRLGATDDQTLWRVVTRPSATNPTDVVPPARLRIVTKDGALVSAVAVSGPHAQTVAAIPGGPEGRRLMVAQAPEWAAHAVVSFDGQPLSPALLVGTPAYTLPSSAGTLTIEIPALRRGWSYAQLAVFALVLFLAIPFGNRRSRRLS